MKIIRANRKLSLFEFKKFNTQYIKFNTVTWCDIQKEMFFGIHVHFQRKYDNLQLIQNYGDKCSKGSSEWSPKNYFTDLL